METAIREATHTEFRVLHTRAVSGGCISQAVIFVGTTASYFVKYNWPATREMFEAEAQALAELAEAKALRVPEPIAHGSTVDSSYLILEALPIGSPQENSWEAMGRQLAKLHRTTARQFGWHRDNVIGSTPQPNAWTDSWPVFFREQRLRHQFQLAEKNGSKFRQSRQVLEEVEELLEDHTPLPSLLHGDLWSGNADFLDDGTPVIYDPATYYGDRETDLAFSQFFGGFPASFCQAYENEWPLEPGYEKRKDLYNLYHVLNHANLFGGGYAEQAKRIIAQLLN